MEEKKTCSTDFSYHCFLDHLDRISLIKIDLEKNRINTLSFCHVVNICLDVFIKLCKAAINVFNHIAHVGEFVKTVKVILVLFAFFVTFGHFFVQIVAKEIVTRNDYGLATCESDFLIPERFVELRPIDSFFRELFDLGCAILETGESLAKVVHLVGCRFVLLHLGLELLHRRVQGAQVIILCFLLARYK